MFLKITFLSLISMPLFSVQIDEEKFNRTIDTYLQSIETTQFLLADTFDEATYHYLVGKMDALMYCKQVFDECKE